MKKTSITRLYSILEKIEYIEQNINTKGSIYQALEDAVTTRPAILMLLAGISEQFSKLRQNNAEELLVYFEDNDLKGMQDIRNFIAHEYDGVDLPIIEWVLEHVLPKLKIQLHKAIAENI